MRKADPLLVVCAALLGSISFQNSPASARDFGFHIGGSIVKGAAKAFGVRPSNPSGSGGGSSHHGSGSGGSDGGSSDTGDSNASDTASKGPITASKSAANSRKIAKEREEIAEYERALKVERARNVDAAIDDFLGELRRQHQDMIAGNKYSSRNANINVTGATSLQINQVTKGQIKAAIDDVYAKAHLQDYDKFAGELWTRDRLMVRILNVASTELEPYFEGVGSRGPSMEDLNSLFDKTAHFVYAEALEVGEIVGVSHSFDRFIRTIYEQSSDTAGVLWTKGADGQYERLVSTVIDDVPRQQFVNNESTQIKDTHGLEKQFQFRFRARRALYDCLSQNYSKLAASAKPMEISANAAQQNGARGARLDGELTTAPASAGAAADVSANAGWRRAQDYVKEVCRGPVLAVAGDALKGDLKPVPARFDTSNAAPPTSAVPPTPVSAP